jgi:2-phospho-L-lactate/phosphoenolpyruvate guanylyltransferase
VPTVVVPFRALDPKRRLDPLGQRERETLAGAMLTDVVAASSAVGEVAVVSSTPPPAALAVRHVADRRRGLGAAVLHALDAVVAASLPAPFLVVNADLPCATPRDLLALAGAIPEDGLALAVAADGTTNALALARADLFEPLYGPGSAGRFAALAPSLRVDVPNLVDDVDTLADLHRLHDRLGPATRAALAALHLGAAA